ncbi:retinitis pigmentosa 1-like 1 protein isoform X2 [Cloeon dipterum]|uniref:retinitis pigmentosa 1-like 1 protein isoform X2 n=1 Tax=Cloeon dipterum TaxID=197152 RepID=UPI00321F672A
MNSSHADAKQALLLVAANDNLKKQIQELETQLKEARAFVEQTNELISVYELIHKQDKAIMDQQNVLIAARDEKIAALGRQEVKKPNCKPTRKGSEKRMLQTLVRLAEKLKANDLLTIYYTKKLEEWTELLNDENNDTYDVDGLEESSKEKPKAPAENLATAVVLSEEAAPPSDAPPSPESEKTAEEKEKEPEATEEAASTAEKNIYVFEPLNSELKAAAEENLIPKDVDGEATVMNDTPVPFADPQYAEAGTPPAGGDQDKAVDIFDEDLVLPYDTPETLSATDNEEMDMLAVEMEEAQSKPVEAGDSTTGCAHQDAAVQEEAEEPNPSTTRKANGEFEDGEDDWMELSDDDSVCDVSMAIDEEAADTEGEEQASSVHQEAPEKETADSQQVIPMVENKSQSAPPADADKVALDLLQAENAGVPAKIVEGQVSHVVSSDLELASLWDTHEEIETQSLALEVPAERAADAPSTLQSSNAEGAADVQNTEEDEEPEMVQPRKVLKRKSGALQQKGCPKKAKKSCKYSPGKTDTPQPRMKIDDEAPDAMGRPRAKKTVGRNKRLLDYPQFEVQRRKKNKQRSQREGINRRVKKLVCCQLCGFTITNL